jgi:hypothetical protein
MYSVICFFFSFGNCVVVADEGRLISSPRLLGRRLIFPLRMGGWRRGRGRGFGIWSFGRVGTRARLLRRFRVRRRDLMEGVVFGGVYDCFSMDELLVQSTKSLAFLVV